MTNSDTKFALTRKIILYTLPILALLGIILPLIFGKFNLSILGSYLAIPMFFAPILYKKLSKNPLKPVYSGNRLFLLLLIFYILCFFISIVLLYMFEIRPISYYVIITLIATSILFEILLFEISNRKSIIILIQIMLLTLNIIWGVTLKYDYFIGRTDPLAHVMYIESLLNSGYVTDLFYDYKPFPLWHILVSSQYTIIGVSIPVYKMMFFINGFIYSFMMLSVYLVSFKIFKKKRLALLSSLFVSLNPDIIYYGMSSIPRSVVSFFEVILILLLLDSNPKRVLLAIILTFTIVVYHSASIPFIILILLIFWLFQKFYGDEKKPKFLTSNYLLITIMITLGYWMFYANELFQTLIENIINTAPVGNITKSIIYTPLNELFNYLQYIPLLIFVIIGILWALQSEKFSGFEKIFCILGLLFVPVTFPGPGLLLNKLAANFNLERFGEYTFLFISIVGAIGFAGIYYRTQRNLKIFIILLFVVMTFLSISNDFNASDNPLIKRPFYTFYLTKEENVAFDHIGNITEGYLMSDYVTTRFFLFSPFESKSHILEVDTENMLFLRNDTLDIVLIREQELGKRPLKLYSMKNDKFRLKPSWLTDLDYYYNDLYLWDTLKGYNKLYDSGGVSGFK